MATRTSAREPLSRDRVLAAAVALADAEGLAGADDAPPRRRPRRRGDVALLPPARQGGPARRPRRDRDRRDRAPRSAAGTDGDRGPTDGLARRRCGGGSSPRARSCCATRGRPGCSARARPSRPACTRYYEGILATLIGAGFSYRLAHRALHAFGSMAARVRPGDVQPAPSAGGEPGRRAPPRRSCAAMAEALPHLTAMVAAEVHDAADPTAGLVRQPGRVRVHRSTCSSTDSPWRDESPTQAREARVY